MGNSQSSSESSPETTLREGSQTQARETAAAPSYWQQIRSGYQELVNAIIRPPRCRYKLSLLGPEFFTFCGASFFRKDFELRNSRGMRLVCSMWLPVPSERKSTALPCVIYMHGNSSGRVEAIGQLATVLSIGATMVAFDFSGSGHSDGDFVSLGYFERDDLQCVVEHIRNAGGTSLIALWGRSMGAATALLHGGRDPSMACMVLDSPFTDLNQLAEELVERGRRNGLFAPSLAVMLAMRAIRSSVMSSAGFDIRDISPISSVENCFIPALFIAAESDTFIAPHHSQRLCERYGGDKNLIIVKGDHNSVRPAFLYDSVSIFLINALRVPEQMLLKGVSSSHVGRSPWRLTSRQYQAYSRDVEQSVTEGTGAALSDVRVHVNSSVSTQEESDEALAWRIMEEEVEAFERIQRLERAPDGDCFTHQPIASANTEYAEVVVSAASDSEEMTMGMTRARQNEIASSIQGVFGGHKVKGSESEEKS